MMNSVVITRSLFRGLSLPCLRPIFVRASAHAVSNSRRSFSFSFVGPRKLEDIIKKDLIKDKEGTEIADIWFTYHEETVRA